MDRMQPLYLIVRTFLRPLVVAGPGVAFLILALSGNFGGFSLGPSALRKHLTHI
jgi:hypothetical protein